MPDAVWILETRGDHAPIGVAYLIGELPTGLALWRLTIGGIEQEGVWLMVDREFRRVE